MAAQLTYITIASLLCLLAVIKNAHGFTLCLSKTNPKQIRLALRPNGITVSWTTDGYFNQNDTPTPQVRYGTDPSALVYTSPVGFTTTYHPLPIFKKFFHNVYLHGLEPSKRYYYQIMATNKCVRESSIRSFLTAPSAESNVGYPVNISVVGDLGLNNVFNTYQAENTIAVMKNHVSNSNFFMHIGDIAYADLYGLIVNIDLYENIWNRFQQAIDPIASNVCYQVLPGNHEVTCFQYSDAVCPSYLRNFTAYNNRFCMSGELSGGYRNMWYSFDYGPVHVIMLNTETDFEKAPGGPGTTLNGGHFFNTTAQQDWLRKDLEKASAPEQRAKVPWIVAAAHRPFFGSPVKATLELAGQPILKPSGTCATCRAAFLPILAQYKVDFFFAGHLHYMELLYPLDAAGNVVAKHFNNVDGIIHLINGAGGAPTGPEKLDMVDEERQAWFFGGYGFHKLSVANSSHATLHFIDSSTATIIKSIDVVRNH